jgi:integrase
MPSQRPEWGRKWGRVGARTTNRLTDLEVRRAKEPGRYADGGGLYLVIDKAGAKRWFYFFTWRGKRVEMGLGPLADRTLAQARDARDEARKLVAAGDNPVEVRKAEKKAKEAPEPVSATFASWAAEIAPTLAPRATKAHAAWKRMMTEWVGPLKDLAPQDIRTEDVLAALKPYWKSRPESGRRMRMRVEAVLDAARAKGLITGAWENPARWKGHLQHLLPKIDRAVKHHLALPYAMAPAFMQQVAERDTMAAYALRFTILTVGRTSEVVFARWHEVGGDVWTCPPERMKMNREHRVPLPAAALEVLERVKPPDGYKPDSWIFPSLFRKGKPLSTAAMERVLEDMGLKGVATVHGFRSTFRDWAGDCTNFDTATIEAALAHLVGDETERAYRRGDALLKRRKLMEAWAGYLARKAGSNVTPMVRPG